MDSQIDKETKDSIRALCDEIAVAHDLDDDFREELRGHVEDKVLAYLNGDVAVSEADAVILAREHFGNRRRLKELLSDVHHVEADSCLWRRIMAGFILVLGVTHGWLMVKAVLEGVGIRAGLFSAQVELGRGVSAPDRGPRGCLALLGATLVIVVLWYILRQWKLALARHERLWFIRWRPAVLVYCALGVVLTCPLAELTQQAAAPRSAGHGPWFLYPSASLVSLPFGLLLALVWAWWCDSGSHRLRTLGAASFSWTVILSHYWLLGTQNLLLPASMSDALVGWPLLRVGHAQWFVIPVGIHELLLRVLYSCSCAVGMMAVYEVGGRLGRHFSRPIGIVDK